MLKSESHVYCNVESKHLSAFEQQLRGVKPSDFYRVDHPSGKKYRAYQHRSLPLVLKEDSTLRKNPKRGDYKYVPSGFLYLYLNGLMQGRIAHGYCFLLKDVSDLIYRLLDQDP